MLAKRLPRGLLPSFVCASLAFHYRVMNALRDGRDLRPSRLGRRFMLAPTMRAMLARLGALLPRFALALPLKTVQCSTHRLFPAEPPTYPSNPHGRTFARQPKQIWV